VGDQPDYVWFMVYIETLNDVPVTGTATGAHFSNEIPSFDGDFRPQYHLAVNLNTFEWNESWARQWRSTQFCGTGDFSCSPENFQGAYAYLDDFLEVGIPWSLIPNNGSVRLHTHIIDENGNYNWGWTWAGAPEGAFTDGSDPTVKSWFVVNRTANSVTVFGP
jgi:hypothetical protein